MSADKTPREIWEGLGETERALLLRLCSQTFATGWNPIITLRTGPTYAGNAPNEVPVAESLLAKGLCEMDYDRQSNQTLPTAWCPDGALGRAVAEYGLSS